MSISIGILDSAAGEAGPPPTFGSHRYWRIASDESNDQGRNPFADTTAAIGWREIELRSAIDGVDRTGSGTASASSVAASNVAANAFDDSLATHWSSSSLIDSHIQYDFGVPIGIEEVNLTPRSENSAGRDNTLEYSDDGVAWTTAFTFDFPWAFTNINRSFPEVTDPSFHRAFRLLCVNDNGGGRTWIHNLEFRATVGGPDQTTNVGFAGNSNGRVITSSRFSSSTEAHEAFNDGLATDQGWLANGASNEWIGFVFPSPVKVEEILVSAGNPFSLARLPKDMLLQYSDDGGTTWITQKTFAPQTGWSTNEERALSAI